MNARVRVEKPAVLAGVPPTGHVLIEAAAGTGKTYTIEHLVVDLLLSGQVQMHQLLVVTFTRKAAAEMAGRIRARLRAVVEAREDDVGAGAAWLIGDVERANLRAALRAFDRATISTIHAFCQRVLTEHRVLTGQVRALSSASTRDVFHDVLLDDVRRTLASARPERALLEDAFEHFGGLEALEALLFPAVNRSDDVRPAWDEATKRAAQRAHAALQRAFAQWLPSGREVTPALLEELLTNGGVQARSASGLAGELAELHRLAANRSEMPTAALQLRMLGELTALAGRAPVRDAADFTGPVGEVLQACAAAHAVMPSREALLIHTLAPRLRGPFLAACAARGAVDFDRLLLETRAALEDPDSGPALLALLRARYRVALVDEFQDTDETQWAVFERLFVTSNDGHRFIAVGDPKQAIYRFRGGDVETYCRARDRLGGVTLPLRVNYRSTPALVDAYNQLLLAQVGGAPLLGSSGVVYDSPVSAGRAGAGLSRPGRRAGAPAIRALELTLGGSPTVELAREVLRSAVVHEVAELLRAPHHFELDGRRGRVRASDVMCLTYTNAEAKDLVSALREAGVPAAQYRASGLWATSEASDLADVLKALARPRDRSLRLLAFRTRFFGVPLEALPDVLALPSNDPRMAQWHAWVASAGRQRWAELFASLRRAGALRRRHHLSAAGRQGLLVLDALLEQAHRLARDGSCDIAALASEVTRRGDEGSTAEREGDEDDDLIPTTERALSGGEGAVRVLTVFKAKGLEAPVVVLAAGVGSERPAGTFAVYHEGGQRLRWVGPTKGPLAPAQLEAEAELERRRLQYVALTRPMVRLVAPMIPEGCEKVLHSKHAATNARLLELAASRAFKLHLDVWAGLDQPVPPPPPATRDEPVPPVPDAAFERASRAPAEEAAVARARARGLQLDSFSKMKPTFEGAPEKPRAKAVMPGELPQGTGPGRLMHALIEVMPLESVVAGQPLEVWRRRPEVAGCLTAWWRRSWWSEAERAEAERLVHLALHGRVTFPDGVTVDGLGTLGARLQREVPFHFPFPASASVFGTPVEGRWALEHGVMKGSIDFAFEFGGKAYLGDWKTNSLDDYGPARLRVSVLSTYDGQVRIYTLALMRALGVATKDDYEARIGGAAYVYLRGLDGSGQGIFAHRPTWAELQALDALLRSRATEEDGLPPLVELVDEGAPGGGDDEEAP